MPSTLDHLEKTLADNYRKEIDQEVNVWRSLPFFAATIAVQIVAAVGLVERLPPLEGAYRWWVGVPAVVVAFATICSVGCLIAAITPAHFSYLASEPDLREYASKLDDAAQANDVPGYKTSGDDARSQFLLTLVEQYAIATHHNRKINQTRFRRRTVAGLFILTSVLSSMVLVGVTAYHHVAP